MVVVSDPYWDYKGSNWWLVEEERLAALFKSASEARSAFDALAGVRSGVLSSRSSRPAYGQ